MIKIINQRTKRSILWKIPLEDLKNTVSKSKTFSEILRTYGLINKGGNCHTLKQRLHNENIDYTHIQEGIGANKGRCFGNIYKMTLEECNTKLFIDKCQLNRNSLKRYLLFYNLLPYKCEICQMNPIWNGKELQLQIDHKNGKCDDNRIENLRWICPNCHSQTETFAGRKLKKRYFCKTCGEETLGYGLNCIKCGNCSRRKVQRPSKEILANEILHTPIETLGKKYGVSGNSIRKWCKYYELF